MALEWIINQINLKKVREEKIERYWCSPDSDSFCLLFYSNVKITHQVKKVNVITVTTLGMLSKELRTIIPCKLDNTRWYKQANSKAPKISFIFKDINSSDQCMEYMNLKEHMNEVHLWKKKSPLSWYTNKLKIL